MASQIHKHKKKLPPWSTWCDTHQQEYTEESHKKGLNDLDNHDGMVTHLEPEILKCEVKWALGSITTTELVEGMEFQLSDLQF